MDKFFLFIRKIHVYILFIILQALAISYFRSSSVHADGEVRTLSWALTSSIDGLYNDISSFINLREENRLLSAELANLRAQADSMRSTLDYYAADTTLVDSVIAGRYEYIPVTVVSNSIVKLRNYITLDKGSRDGIQDKMALLAPSGIVGYVIGVSDKFSVAISVLNIDFRSSGKIKDSDYYGSILWDGVSNEYVTMTEIPKYAQLEKGDTITSTTYSSIFPADINIGVIDSYELVNGTYYKAKIALTQQMGRLENVIAVKYLDGYEREMLLEENNITE